jgi:hypothetical protein
MQRFPFFRVFLSLGVFLVLLSVVSVVSTAAGPRRIRPVPQFTPGLTLRYNIETNTVSNQHTTTPIVNSEGASQYRQSTSLVVRLEVIDSPASQAPEGVRLRVTFEQARSVSEADAYAPEAVALDDAITKLEGQSIEFTWTPDNQMAAVNGFDRAANREAVKRALSWIRVLCAPVDLPRDGVEVGQKWDSERPLNEVPLTGVTWHNDSSYLRDESCGASSKASSPGAATQPGGTQPAADGDCAVLLTHFEISRHGSEHSDASPQEYIRSGLRTSGKWNGSGESLDAVSLARGFLVSSTQTAKQDMDYEISSPSSGSRIHHVGQTSSQTEITLLPPSSPK